MKKVSPLVIALGVVGLLLTLGLVYFFVFNKDVEISDTGKRLVYRYNDSSVSSEYQRNYEITLTEKGVKIVVDSYGDILEEKSFSLSKGQTSKFFDGLGEYSLEILEEGSDMNNGCVGGTSDSLKMYDKENFLTLDGVRSSCGGQTNGNISGDFDSLVNDITELVPNFENLLK